MAKKGNTKESSAKNRFMRFCFASGVCSKGKDGKVKGLNSGNRTTIIKAMKGNEKASKRLTSELRSRGGVIFSDKNKNRITKSINKNEKEVKDSVKSFSEKNNGIDRKVLANVVRNNRKLNLSDIRKKERNEISKAANSLQVEKILLQSKAKGALREKKISKEVYDNVIKESDKIYRKKLSEKLDYLANKHSASYSKAKGAKKVYTDIDFVKSVAKRK